MDQFTDKAKGFALGAALLLLLAWPFLGLAYTLTLN